MRETLVSLEHVALRTAEGRPVFEDLCASVPRGARIRVAAARGAGATAFLRLCAGLAHAVGGRVLLDGVPHEPYAFSHPYLARGAVGWVPQDGALVANLSLLQNVALPLRFARGMGSAEAGELAASWLAALGLAERRDERPHALSRGERHRAALARSAAAGAELWLWDRPLDELDAPALARAVAALRPLLDDPSRTVVVAGDDPAYESFAPAVWRLEQDRLIPGGDA